MDEVRTAWAARHGRTWTHEDTRAVMGANSRGWGRIMRERLGLPAADEAGIVDEVVEGVVARYHDSGAPVIPGAVEAARRIAETMPVAIASSAHRAVIDAAHEATGLRTPFTSLSLPTRSSTASPRRTSTSWPPESWGSTQAAAWSSRTR